MSSYVLFFGGYKATLVNIKAWMASALVQNSSVMFDGYPYPDGVSADGDKAVDAFTNGKTHDLAAAIKKIEAAKADKIYIVGHSSGCAIANKVDANLKDHSKIALVALDGYSPSDAQLDRPSTQVWVAQSDTGKSLHFHDLQERMKKYNAKAKARNELNIYPAARGSSTKLALHFSLVNTASSDTLVTQIPDGYNECKANLAWLS